MDHITTNKLIHLKLDADEGEENDKDDEDKKFPIGILNPSTCQRRREFEHTDFHVRKPLSNLQERLMTTLENCLVQVDLLAALPFLSQHLAEYEEEKQREMSIRRKEKANGKGKRQEGERERRGVGECILPNILGRDSIRALYRLFTATQKQTHNKTAQMVWTKTKYGEKIQSGSISSSFSSSASTSSHYHGQFNNNNNSNNDINRSEEEGEEKPDSKNENPVCELYKRQKTTSTSFSVYDSSNISKWETDRKAKKQEKKQSKLEKKQERKNQFISMLEKKDNVSQLKFLSSLLQGSEDEKEDDNVGGSTLSRIDDSALCTKDSKDGEHDNKIKGEEKKRLKRNINILRQIRAALGSKYGDHVKKALEDKDKRSLLCMLALLPPSADQTVAHKSTEKDRKEGIGKKHKTTCRKYNQKKKDQNLQETKMSVHKEKQQEQQDNKDDDEELDEEYYYEDENDEESFGLRLIMIEDETKIRRFDSQNSSRLSNSSLNSRGNSRLLSSSTSSSTCFLSPNDDVGNDNYDFPDDDDSSSSSSLFLSSDIWGRNEDDDLEIVEEGEEEENYREFTGIFHNVDVDEVEVGQNEHQVQVLKIPLDDYSFLPFVSKSISSSSSSFDSIEQRPLNETNRTNTRIARTRYPDIPEERIENLSMTDEVDIKRSRFSHGKDEKMIKQSTKLENRSQTMKNKMSQKTIPLELMIEKNLQEENLKRAIRHVFQHLSMDPKYFQYKMQTSNRCLNQQTKLEENITTDEKQEQDVIWKCTEGLQNFRKYFHALVLLMRDRLGTSVEEKIQRDQKLLETWKSERRALKELKALQIELKRLEDVHTPKMLTLDFQIRILNSRLHQVSKENFGNIRQVIRETELNAAVGAKQLMTTVEKAEQAVGKREETKVILRSQLQIEELKLKNKRKEFDSKLRDEIERYDERLFKLQNNLDTIIEEKFENEGIVVAIQRKFENVEDRFCNMRGAKKLRQIMKNREIADEFKRNRAAKLIQDIWKRYKARKRRRERKGKKKGKKKKK